MAFTLLDQGSFTSAGVGVSIPLPGSADYFKVQNLTQLATTQVVGRGVVFEWYKDLVADDNAIKWGKEDGDDILNMDLVTSGGFTYVTSFPQPEAAVTGGTITRGATTTVTLANSYSEGDSVILYNTTGMLQIGGMSFTISTVTGADFILAGLNSSGFAADATAVTSRRIPKVMPIEPSFLYVTAITQANPAVVTVSQSHSYVVGQKVRLSIPSSFGMSEMDSLEGKITAVGTYTMTLDIDSSAFSAFAFPASAGSPTTRLFATLSPAGQSTQYDPVTMVQTGYNFQYAPFHSGLFLPYMFLSSGAQSPAGSTDDVIAWQAWKAE